MTTAAANREMTYFRKREHIRHLFDIHLESSGHTDTTSTQKWEFPSFDSFQQPLHGLTAHVDDDYLASAFTQQVDYLLGFDPERFLVEFRRNAGLSTKGLTTYGGWEAGSRAEDNPDNAEYPADQELREKTGDLHVVSTDAHRRVNPLRFTGHYFGHWMRACEHALHSSNITQEQREQLAHKAATAVIGLRQTQLAYAEYNPHDAGYLPAYPVDALPDGKDGVMVPFYNLHKVLQGLIDLSSVDFESMGITSSDEEHNVAYLALLTASDFARFILMWSKRNPEVNMLSTEYGGMNEALYNLALAQRRQGDVECELLASQTAHLFDELDLFIRLAHGEDCLPGLHVNTTIPKLIGAARAVQVYAGNSLTMRGIAHDIRQHAHTLGINVEELPAYPLSKISTTARQIFTAHNSEPLNDDDVSLVFGVYYAAARNFWELATGKHAYAIGVPSQAEHFHELTEMWSAANLSGDEKGGYRNPSTCETCCAHNLLRLSYLLMSESGEALCANQAEFIHRNAILGSRDPNTGMVTYFQPMRAGYTKVYGPQRGEFWCCLGTGLENWTLLGQAAYFRDEENTIYLTRALSSTLDLGEGRSLVQKDYLSFDGSVSVTYQAAQGSPSSLSLKIRVPRWAQSMVVYSLGDDLVLAPSDSWVHVTIEAQETLVFKYQRKASVISHDEHPSWIAFQYGIDVLGQQLSSTDAQSNYQYGGILVRVSTFDENAYQRSLLPLDQPLEQWESSIDEHLHVLEENGKETSKATALATQVHSHVSTEKRTAGKQRTASLQPQNTPRYELSGLAHGAKRELIPYYALHNSVNAVYFDVINPSE